MLKEKDPVLSLSQHRNSTKVDAFTKEEAIAKARKESGKFKRQV